MTPGSVLSSFNSVSKYKMSRCLLRQRPEGFIGKGHATVSVGVRHLSISTFTLIVRTTGVRYIICYQLSPVWLQHGLRPFIGSRVGNDINMVSVFYQTTWPQQAQHAVWCWIGSRYHDFSMVSVSIILSPVSIISNNLCMASIILLNWIYYFISSTYTYLSTYWPQHAARVSRILGPQDFSIIWCRFSSKGPVHVLVNRSAPEVRRCFRHGFAPKYKPAPSCLPAN